MAFFNLFPGQQYDSITVLYSGFDGGYFHLKAAESLTLTLLHVSFPPIDPQIRMKKLTADAAEIATGNGTGTAPKGGGKTRLLTLDSLDGRTTAAKRARELVDGLAGDLGGSDHITVAERQLVQRAAVLGAIIEHQEAAILTGKPVDVSDHLAAVNAQRRVLTTIGLERRARDVTPSLSKYLEGQTT